MKKYFVLLLCLSFFSMSQAQTFFEVHNLSSRGITVIVEETSSQVYLASIGSTTAPSFSKQIFSASSISQVTLRLSYDGKTKRAVLPIYNGRVTISDSDIGVSNTSGTNNSVSSSLTGTTFIKKDKNVKDSYESGHFVKVFNLTPYKLYGMTDEIRGYIIDPGGLTDTTEGNRNYIVSESLGISYNPLQNYFLDRQGTIIKDTVLLDRILNSSISLSAMVNIWLPDKDLNWNLRYQDNVIALLEEDVLLDLVVVVQRMVNSSTQIVTITVDDLKDYRPHGQTTKRRIQNKTSREFIFELAGKQLVIPPKKGRKMSLSDKFYLPEGAYYIPMSMIDKGKMYQFYFLTIFNDKTDIYPEINAWNLKGLRIFGQTSLE